MGIFERRCCATKPNRAVGCAVAAAFLSLFAAESYGSKFARLDYNLTLNTRSRNTVFIELFDDRPLTQSNFLQYVNGEKYDGTIMHRLARNFVIQGGGFYPEFVEEPPPVHVSLDPNAKVDLDGNSATLNPTVMNEYAITPTRSNVRGTLAMAKVAGDPNSATNQWFVNLANNTSLNTSNGGFTVFGGVIGDGMALFDAFNSLTIANLNPDSNDDGFRDGGPFYNYDAGGTDGVPYLAGANGDILVVLEDAEEIDYLGNGSTTNVPAGGITFSARDAYIDTGAVFAGTGELTVGAGRTLGIREGFLLNRSLTNLGTLAPGLQLGSITLQAFRQDPGAHLEIQLRGTTADTQHDRIVVTGGALLGGDLDVSLISGYVPAINNTFTVLTAGLIADTFDNFNLPQLNAGLVWDITQSSTAITLTVSAGDFNRDGVVDGADYVVWRKQFGQNLTAYAGADGSGNGMVDTADFTIWRNNFGNKRGGTVSPGGGSGGGTASQAVPEPSSFGMLVLAAIPFLARRRKPASRPA